MSDEHSDVFEEEQALAKGSRYALTEIGGRRPWSLSLSEGRLKELQAAEGAAFRASRAAGKDAEGKGTEAEDGADEAAAA